MNALGSAQPVAIPASGSNLLEVKDLTTTIKLRRGTIRPVDGVSLSVKQGEILGLVGESGSGKSMTALTIMRLLPPAATAPTGSVRFNGVELLRLSRSQMRDLRGKEISMVFQEPMTALDPAFTIGSQLTETILAHEGGDHGAAGKRAVEMLDRVGIVNAASRLHDYPHQFSGGMRQRVMLAMALLLRPKLLLADEPTTALDVTIQAQILKLIARLQAEMEMSVILITHNLGVVAEIADRVAVMYAGEIAEVAPVWRMFENPLHPYTQGLLRSMPDLKRREETLHVIGGRVPELSALPAGCRFNPRCPNRIDRCVQSHPSLESVEPGHELRCYNPTPYQR